MTALMTCALLPIAAARAQSVDTLSNLYLSNGSELDFALYGANGGSSDRINVQNQFNFSGAEGNYTIGFSAGDSATLTAGTAFTLVTFGSTNFTTTSVSDFHAMPEGNLSSISGTFQLIQPNSVNGTPGVLQFTLINAQEIPEPSALSLLAAALGAAGICAVLSRTRRYQRNNQNFFLH